MIPYQSNKSMELAFKIKFTLVVLALGIFTLCSLSSEASREFSKTIKKEFDISADGTTDIFNKYGRVNIQTWDRNRVKVEVMIVVQASEEKIAQSIFDRISVDFSNSSNYVSAKTNIASKKDNWWKDNNNNKVDYSINYEIWMPPTNRLELEARYGDVQVAPLSSDAKVSVKYGNLTLQGIEDDLDLYLGYGRGTIKKVSDAHIEAGHCSLIIGDAEDLEIESKYSNITVERAGDIRSQTRYDTYKLGQIGEFRNSGKYDNLEIERAESVYVDSDYTHLSANSVTKAINVEIANGHVSIAEIASGFSEATLLGEYSDFKVGIAKGASFSLDANATYAGIGYPANLKVDYEKERMNAHEVKGHVGSAGGTIKARLRYGALKVRSN